MAARTQASLGAARRPPPPGPRADPDAKGSPHEFPVPDIDPTSHICFSTSRGRVAEACFDPDDVVEGSYLFGYETWVSPAT